MNKELEYKIKNAKIDVLDGAGAAYRALGIRYGKSNDKDEATLIARAMYKVLEKDAKSEDKIEEQLLELKGLSYMLKGIADHHPIYISDMYMFDNAIDGGTF